MGRRRRFLDMFAGWPMIGRLRDVPADALKEARDEILSATFFATMPFWFLPLIGMAIFSEPPQLVAGLQGGELFIYAATLVAPLAYVIHKRYGRFAVPEDEGNEEPTPLTYPFPYGKSFSYAVILICIISGVVFAIQRVEAIESLRKLRFINTSGLLWLSVIVFAIATLMLFCVTAYRNMLESLQERHSKRISHSLIQQEDDTIREWQTKKEQGDG